MSMLNARAITSPTAMTITSPRIRKFLKPLIVMSPLRVAVIQVWFGAWTFDLYLGYLLPLLSVASNHVNDRGHGRFGHSGDQQPESGNQDPPQREGVDGLASQDADRHRQADKDQDQRAKHEGRQPRTARRSLRARWRLPRRRPLPCHGAHAT